MTDLTRSSYKWVAQPGSADTVNARWLFESSNKFGIPDLTTTNHDLIVEKPPAWLAPYRARIRNDQKAQEGGLHCFLDDYRFEALWERPIKTLEGLYPFGVVFSPDFSLYRDWPVAVQIWNIYRSRWVAAWWQSNGLTVVPSVSWAGPRSYEFCFLGIPAGSVVAVSVVGLGRDRVAWKLFEAGYKVMLERFEPRMILCYGQLPQELLTLTSTPVKCYPTYWQGLRAASSEFKTDSSVVSE